MFWLVVGPPLWTMKVNWDDDIPNIWENEKCSKPPTSSPKNVPNHQPVFQVFSFRSKIWRFPPQNLQKKTEICPSFQIAPKSPARQNQKDSMWNTFSSRWRKFLPVKPPCPRRKPCLCFESRTKRAEKVFGQIKPDRAESSIHAGEFHSSMMFHVSVSRGLALILPTTWPPLVAIPQVGWPAFYQCLAVLGKSPNPEHPERLAYIL